MGCGIVIVSLFLRFKTVSSPFQIPFMEWDLQGICLGGTWEIDGERDNEKFPYSCYGEEYGKVLF